MICEAVRLTVYFFDKKGIYNDVMCSSTDVELVKNWKLVLCIIIPTHKQGTVEVIQMFNALETNESSLLVSVKWSSYRLPPKWNYLPTVWFSCHN